MTLVLSTCSLHTSYYCYNLKTDKMMCTKKFQLCQEPPNDHRLEVHVPKYNKSKLLPVPVASALPQICHQMTAVDNRKDSSGPREESFLPLKHWESFHNVYEAHVVGVGVGDCWRVRSANAFPLWNLVEREREFSSLSTRSSRYLCDKWQLSRKDIFIYLTKLHDVKAFRNEDSSMQGNCPCLC